MRVTRDQIRAARALMDWSQGDLAKRSGLARPTIANIEAGHQVPGAKTLDRIVSAFETADVVFIEGEGVRKKRDTVQIFQGRERFKEFFEFVYHAAISDGGSFFLNNIQDNRFEHWYPGFYESDYVRKMTKVRDQMDFRIILREGNTRFPLKDKYVTYRWLPENQFTGVPFEVFGQHLAVFLLSVDEPVVFVLRNKEIADLYRKKFIEQWENAIVPPELRERGRAFEWPEEPQSSGPRE